MSDATCRLVYDLGQGPMRKKLSRGRAVLGRAPGCEVMLPAKAVSRRHAAMEFSDGAWNISDLGSLNGVSVNGQSITTRVLEDNDRITIGSVELTYHVLTADDTRVGGTQVVVPPTRGKSASLTTMFMGNFDPIVAKAVKPDDAGAAEEESDTEGWAGLIELLGEATERLVASETLDDMLRGLLDVALQSIPAERGAICLCNPETGTLVPTVVQVEIGDPDQELVISRTITDEVLTKEMPVLFSDTTTDSRSDDAGSLKGNKICSVLCAPLFRDGEATGLIYLDSSGSTSLEKHHLRLLSSLAIIAAIGVEQMRLRELVNSERKRRERLQRYLPQQVVDNIISSGETTLSRMVTSEREVTVLFCDLHRFTRIAESLPADEVVALLNDIFDDLTHVVFELDGTLDKFTGDGLVAIFGAPFDQEDHARRAVLAALRMRDAIAKIDEVSQIGFPLRMRFGINSGKVIAGDIGATIRCDYTVIGDVVNVASRLESTVARAGEVIIGAATRALLAGEFECEQLDEVEIRGRKKPERPFRVTGGVTAETPEPDAVDTGH